MDEYHDEDELYKPKGTPEQQAAVKELISANVRLTVALHTLAQVLAGGFIQLRSHERGSFNHDDVTLNLKTETLAIIQQTYESVYEVIQGCTPQTVIDIEKLQMPVCEVPYKAGIKALFEKYAGAYNGSKLSHKLLIVISATVGEGLDAVFAQLITTYASSFRAKEVGAVENEFSELPGITCRLIGIVWSDLLAEIETTFDKATPALDRIAAAENKYYTYLVKEGYADIDAQQAVEKRYHGRVRKILFPDDPK